jgi:serine/threonine protein kinase
MPDELIIILEYNEDAIELLEYLQLNAPLPVEQASQLATQLFSAVAHLRKMHICHRDIKLENILISKDKITLIDFNLATFFTASGPFTEPCGTLEYSTPQSLREYETGYVFSEPYQDVWSAGIVVYAMLTGRLPFTGTTPAQVFKSIQSLPEKLLLIQDKEAMDFLQTLFDYSRKPSAESLLSHSFLAKSTSPVDTLSSSLPYMTPKRRDRRPSSILHVETASTLDAKLLSDLISTDSTRQMQALGEVITPRLAARRRLLGSPVSSPLLSASSFSTVADKPRRISFQVFDTQDAPEEQEEVAQMTVMDEDDVKTVIKSAKRSFSSGSLFEFEQYNA